MEYGPPFWTPNMVPKMWTLNMDPKYGLSIGPLIWTPNNLGRRFHGEIMGKYWVINGNGEIMGNPWGMPLGRQKLVLLWICSTNLHI
jgi:hypothetical protein